MPEHVAELITDDHRRFEDLIRTVRDTTADRASALAELSTLLIAHAEAEEHEVYPALERTDAADGEEVEHSEREHHQITAALLLVLETDLEDEEFPERLHELSEVLAHHIDEEERDLLNGAREELDPAEATELGRRFLAARQAQIDQGCGSLANVRSEQHPDGLDHLDLAQLSFLAAQQDVEGRSSMNKGELVAALART